jgi:uncharacterized membrane protein YqiK
LIAERIADAALKKSTGEANGVKIAASAEAERTKMIASADAERTKMSAAAESEKVRLMAQAEAEKIELTGKAEAEKTLAVGQSSAEAYRLAVEAMGGDNFTKMKVMETIGQEKVKIIPDVLITGEGGGANGAIGGMLGLRLLDMLKTEHKTEPKEQQA